ncbi:DNA/RNA non-specific endonuclease [Ligilactobacillus ceti]|uniref:DNA-entry nuclease n=1 Tax=Ligilactobacillus ceti DSM 22408 TaxID=1122146 RepID=A0A0R2KG80_9LACO|nr:DNA/RNA non-specific endonuclease [Ligilactobacillus ceti]KRN88418.1 DNA-entry nuclease [Ligilactobacillus ceti DSM 22408]
MFKQKNKFKLLVTIVSVMTLLLTGCSQSNQTAQESSSTTPKTKVVQQSKQAISQAKQKEPQTKTTHYNSQYTPTEELSRSVLTNDVVTKLGGLALIKWNGAGAFIINNNHNKLKVIRGNRPYAQCQVDDLGRPVMVDSLLTKATRQYKNRRKTGNGASKWKPAGFHQMKLNGKWNHLYDRGHLLAYSLVGNLRGFDASERNIKNIATQTAWANEARSHNSTGQNYFETKVRKALDRHKTVRYRVTNIYQGRNIIPSGAQLQAKSLDGSLEFNVFIPNVQPGVLINYETGYAKVA